MMMLLCLWRPLVCGLWGEGREGRRRGAERGKRRVEFSGGADFSYTSHPLFTLVYLPHLQNPSLSLRYVLSKAPKPYLCWQHIFLFWQIFLTTSISHTYSTSLFTTSLSYLSQELPQHLGLGIYSLSGRHQGRMESDTNKQGVHYSNKITCKNGIPCISPLHLNQHSVVKIATVLLQNIRVYPVKARNSHVSRWELIRYPVAVWSTRGSTWATKKYFS